MSKNVKSNNKNTKKSASKAKKFTRNNYKIESLEPRLMMDADVNLEEFGNQIESISTVVDNSISSISDLDLSSLGLDSKLDSASELISNSGVSELSFVQKGHPFP